MSNSNTIFRSLLVFGICLPLAIFVGYLMATPEDRDSLVVMGLVFGVLVLPLLMRWHHPLLLLSWNMSAIFFVLPGQLPVWVVIAVISLTIAVFQRALNQEVKFLPAWSVVYPLIFLGLVVLVTAKLTGGINFRVGGSGTYGGRRYIFLFGAIIGFLALISRRVALPAANRSMALFLLAGVTVAIANLVTVVNPSWYFIFLLFPPDLAAFQQANSYMAGDTIERLGGLGRAASYIICFLLARYGVRQTLDPRSLWRPVLLVLMMVAALFGGFRSILIAIVLTFIFMFCLEGLLRTRVLPMLVVGAIAVCAAFLPFMERLPLSVQRSFSFLPVRVHPAVAADAQASSEWRMQMWKELYPEVPRYLLLGKGYAINGDELELAQNLASTGRGNTAQVAMLAGDYHSGPLSVLIPLGIWGGLGFIWFLIAAGRALYLNYRYGELELKHINTFLFALFIAQIIMFIGVYGSFYDGLVGFTGIVGLSISLNGGICKRPETSAAALPTGLPIPPKPMRFSPARVARLPQ